MAEREKTSFEIQREGEEQATFEAAFLKDPTEKPWVTLEWGFLPQLNIPSQLGLRHVNPVLADLADSLTDPISAVLFGLTAKGVAAGVKGTAGAIRSGVRGSVKSAKTATDVTTLMADRLARRAGKGLETQSWEALRPIVEKGIEEGRSGEFVRNQLAQIQANKPRWKSAAGVQMTPSSKDLETIRAAITGTKKAPGSLQDALGFIDDQISLRRGLHAKVIDAGKGSDPNAFLSALDEVYKREPSARMKILRKGAKREMELAERGLERTRPEEFARLHPTITTFAPGYQKAGLVPGGEIGAEAVARAQKWPVGREGFESVVIGFGKIAQAIKGGIPAPEGAAAADVVKTHIADVQWGDVATATVMQDFSRKLDLPARGRVMTMVMNPGEAFEGVAKDIGKASFKTAQDTPVGSLASLRLKPEFGASEAEVYVADSLKAMLEDTGKYLVEADVIRGMLDNYFPRLIKRYGAAVKDKAKLTVLEKLKEKIVGESGVVGRSGKLSGFTKHGLPRSLAYDELLKLEKEGVLELEKDPVRILQSYFSSVNKAAADKRSIARLAQNNFPVEGAWSQPTKAGAYLAPEVTKEPPTKGSLFYSRDQPPPKAIAKQYELSSDPSILSVARSKYGKDVGSQVWVLSEAHAPMRRAFAAGAYQGPAKSISEGAMRAALTLNSFAKRSSMFFSTFHLVSLTESMLMEMGLKGLPFFNPRAFSRATKALHTASDQMELAVRSGMTVGPIIDAEWNVFTNALKGAEDWLKSKRLPIVGNLAGKTLGNAVAAWNRVDGAWNRFMWDYYQNGAKMMAFSELYYDALRKFPNQTPSQIAESVATHVNNAIGGINWERFWFSKQGQQWARLLLFAPDWTLTNLMVAADVFGAKFIKTPGARLPGKFLLSDDPRAYYARQFAMRARTVPAALANLLNHATTSWRTGRGHYMDENDEGNRDRVEMPWLDGKGRKQYYRFGKQFREPHELLRIWETGEGPRRFLAKKAGIGVQFTYSLWAEKDVMGQPVFTTKNGWVQKLGQRFGYGQDQVLWLQNISDIAKLSGEYAGVPLQVRQLYDMSQGDKPPVQALALSLMGAPIYGPKGKKKKSRAGARVL